MRHFYAGAVLALSLACARSSVDDEHTAHPAPSTSAAAATTVQPTRPVLPAGAADVDARLVASPRHSEWQMVRASGNDSVRVWVVYPERSSRAPVVIVVHEIYGLTPWIRGVADQLAADGFIAVAPDFLTGHTGNVHPDSITPDEARGLIRQLDDAQIQSRIDAVARWATSQPAATARYGIVGFCWGGSVVFEHAVHAPGLGAGVAFYGSAPSPQELRTVRAPILGLYGENDARVNATIAPTDSAMRALNKTYDPHVFPGAGHGFLRQQDGQSGSNLEATRRAWPLTLSWFRTHLESAQSQ